MELNEEWTVEVVAKMHRYKITGVELAAECAKPFKTSPERSGYSTTYLSLVLNGKKKFMSEVSKEQTKRVITDALERLIARRMEG